MSISLSFCFRLLDPSFFARTTSIVRHRCNIFDRFDVYSSRLQCGDRTFSPPARSIDANIDIFDAEFLRLLRCLLCCTLAGKGCAFAAAFEAGCPSTGPAERITFDIGHRDRCVVERCLDVNNANRNVTSNFLLFAFCHCLTDSSLHADTSLHSEDQT